MDVGLSNEQHAVRKEVRRFGENEIAPIASEYGVEEKFPWDVMDMAAEMGLTGASIPVEYGGVGYTPVELAIVVEELFAIDPGIGLWSTPKNENSSDDRSLNFRRSSTSSPRCTPVRRRRASSRTSRRGQSKTRVES